MQEIQPTKRIPIWAGRLCWLGFAVSLVAAGVLLLARGRPLSATGIERYTPLTGEAAWQGEWRFSELGADPGQAGGAAVTIPFNGTDFALQVRRGNYRGYLYVTVDGRPANQLPRSPRGAYLILTSPDLHPQVTVVPVSSGLANEAHIASIAVDRAWDQWPLAGWEVAQRPDTRAIDWALRAVVLLNLLSFGGAAWLAIPVARRRAHAYWAAWSAGAADIRARILPLWGGLHATQAAAMYHKARAYAQMHTSIVLCIALVSALGFYFSPWLLMALAGLVVVVLIILLRLDIGLGLVLAAAPFYRYGRPLLGKEFSMVEILLLICVSVHLIHSVDRWLRGEPQITRPCRRRPLLDGLDAAVVCLVLVSGVSTALASYRHVALRELRVMFIEPALFYWIIRSSKLDRRAAWRIVDLFLLGATVVAVIGLAQYALNTNVITAEGGFRRLRSVYGSPNNVGLTLGRVLPLLLASVLWTRLPRRRMVYAVALAAIGSATLLSFSKGALLLGIPLAVLALGVLAGRPWSWIAAAALVVAGLAATPLFTTPRFASMLDTSQGSTFFRLELWRSSLAMVGSAPLFGVGPDNFLYAYRGRFILPAAWQEPNISLANNLILDFATRLGLVGLGAAIWLQVAFWRRALPLRHLKNPNDRALALGLMGMMAAYLGHGLVDSSHFVIDLAYIFSFTIGLIQWLSRREPYGIEKQSD